MKAFEKIQSYQSPLATEKGTVQTIDMHTGGEPLRVIIGGLPKINADGVLGYRRILRDQFDSLRTGLMHEPRGHRDMYGVYLVPPNDDEADFGAVFIHNEGYSTMCGHAVIALGKLAVKKGWVDSAGENTPVIIDAPCGRIYCSYDEKRDEVSFEGVPSFVAGEGILNLDGKEISYTVAYGGAYYAYVDALQLGLTLHESSNELIRLGMLIKERVIRENQGLTEHPFETDLSFLYGTIFYNGKANSKDCYDRNVCIFADGEVDRSPTGSGVSGRMAIHFEKGDITVGQEIAIESIAGSVFKAQVKSSLKYGPYNAVIPIVSGNAYLTGYHNFIFDPDDSFKDGFLLH